jgi:hypothetical protein
MNSDANFLIYKSKSYRIRALGQQQQEPYQLRW